MKLRQIQTLVSAALVALTSACGQTNDAPLGSAHDNRKFPEPSKK